MHLLTTIFSALRRPLNPEPEYTMPRQHKRILNYVWINGNNFYLVKGARCGVPLHYLDRALENAARYPDVEVKIWMDYNKLDPISVKIALGHVFKTDQTGQRKHPNVTVHNLHDVPDFTVSGCDDPDKVSVWDRVDYARFMVLQHCLDTTDADAVFYSDFDCEDVSLNTKRVHQALDTYGMCFGHAENMRREMPVHGFIGLQRSNLDTDFFDGLMRSMRYFIDAGRPIWFDFERNIDNWANAMGDEQAIYEILRAVDLPEIRSQFLPDPKYVDCGFNHDLQCTR